MTVAPPVPAPTVPGRRSVLRSLVRTARPTQWVKNVVVLAAPAAAGVLGQAGALLRTLAAVLVFCVVASGTYFLNDAADADADRHHPRKRHRPVAAGELSVRSALGIGVALLAAGIAGAALINLRCAAVVAVYVAVQFGYSYHLKHQPVLDLASVASGFVLRGIAGGVAAGVVLSQWFLIVTSFASLLMVTGKRLAEHLELGDARRSHRATLELYSATFLRTVIAISAAGAILGYCLWAFDLQTALLHHEDPVWYQLSVVPVGLALLRYTYIVESGRGGRPERVLFGDRTLLVLGAVWALIFTVGVYAH